jgi:predicted phage-related endonuclease
MIATNETEWLARKQRRIGSSDARVILGCGYEDESLSDLYQRMQTGKRKSFSPQTLEMLRDGKIMEPAIIKLFEARNPEYKVEPNEGFNLIVPESHPYLCATLDASVVHIPTGERGVLECKFESFGSFADYDDQGLPLKHLVQIEHQLICTGWSFGFLATMVKGKFIQRRIDRDEALIEQMHIAYRSFMDHVNAGIEPQDTGRLEAAAKGSDESRWAKYLGRDASDMVREIVQLQTAQSATARKIESIVGKLKPVVGKFSFYVLDDQTNISVSKGGLLKVVSSLPRGVRVSR